MNLSRCWFVMVALFLLAQPQIIGRTAAASSKGDPKEEEDIGAPIKAAAQKAVDALNLKDVGKLKGRLLRILDAEKLQNTVYGPHLEEAIKNYTMAERTNLEHLAHGAKLSLKKHHPPWAPTPAPAPAPAPAAGL